MEIMETTAMLSESCSQHLRSTHLHNTDGKVVRNVGSAAKDHFFEQKCFPSSSSVFR